MGRQKSRVAAPALRREAKPLAGNDSALSPNERRLDFGERWTYAPAPEQSDYIKIKPRYQLFIDGKFRAPHSGKYFDSINPATEEKLAEIAEADAHDVDLAVQAARRAHRKVWSKMPGRERGKYLYRIARLVQEKSRELAVLESMDGGKTIKESRDIDLPLVAAHFFYYAGWADKLDYAFPGRTPRSLGVAGQIIPWNFPLLMAAWKLAPALAAETPVCSNRPRRPASPRCIWREIFQEAELPDGVVNIVTGAGETGQALVEHDDVNKIAFTGSTAVGKDAALAPSPGRRRSSLSSSAARRRTSFSKTRRSIRRSKASFQASILIRDTSVARARVCSCRKAFSLRSFASCAIASRPSGSAIRSIKTPTSARSIRGCSSTRFASWSRAACKQGAELVQPRLRLPEKGYWYPPSFFTGVTASHRIAQEEIFGPVLSVMTFRTPEEAIERANNTPYGLSAGVWTDKGSKIFKIVSKLRAGVVWANTYNKFDPTSPFGGYRESGFGREGGLHGLLPYLALG